MSNVPGDGDPSESIPDHAISGQPEEADGLPEIFFEEIFHGIGSVRSLALASLLCFLPPFHAGAQAQTALPISSVAASPKSQDPLKRDSPQSSVYSFLEACHARDYNRASKYLDLRKLPPDQRLKEGPQFAQQLEQILDRDAQFDVASLSHSPDGDRPNRLPSTREHVASFKDVDGHTLELQLERMALIGSFHLAVFFR